MIGFDIMERFPIIVHSLSIQQHWAPKYCGLFQCSEGTYKMEYDHYLLGMERNARKECSGNAH